MNVRLNGISFVDMPHISKGDAAIIVREEGELWDSDARPAYSVRMDGLHVGYIPLVETLKEEALKARDEQLKKKWRKGMEDLTPAQLRAIAVNLNETGELTEFHEWVTVDEDKAKAIAKRKMHEAEIVEVVRDYLYVEIMRNHLTPRCTLSPMYYDEKEGRNFNEIGDICSVSAFIDTEGCGEKPLARMRDVVDLTEEAARLDGRFD